MNASTGPVSISREGDIAFIEVDNPPVNALSQEVRQGLQDAVAEIAGDDAIKGAVLICKGRTFIAGADIREFGKPMAAPALPPVIDTMEALQKPLVAAIHGTALGGGLETALGCHYRIMDPRAQVGLPEVTLGILPGAGGTQRTPRLIGIDKAVEIITTGRRVKAREALELGLADAIADGDLRESAVAFLRQKLGEAGPLPTASGRPNPALDEEKFAALRAEVEKRARGQISPVRIMDAIRAAADLPFADGLAKERQIFSELVTSDQSKALRYAFFGERAVGKIPGLGKPDLKPIASVGVIGCGTMGTGISGACITNGLKVTIVETSDEAAEAGHERVKGLFAGRVKRGQMSQAQADEILSRVTMSTSYDDLADCDLIIEAVFEEMPLKKEVFRKLDPIAKDGAILATNTSYLDVDEIAAETKRPESVLGLHFFSPAHVTRLLEIVRGEKTSPEVLATALDLAKKLKKVGVVSGVCDGFIGNRILSKYALQISYMIEDGAWPEDIDKAMVDFGMAMGPFAVSDLAGLDIGWRRRKATKDTADPDVRYSEVSDRLCELGHYGQKTGAGYYRYEKGSRVPQVHDVTRQIIEDIRKEKGINLREIPAEEIQNTVLAAMVNEGAKILEEHIAYRPVDIDQVYLNGYAYPRWRGGPMFQADLMGIPKVLELVETMCENSGHGWTVAPLLRKMAEEGTTFGDMNGD